MDSFQEDPTPVLATGPEPVTLADEGIPTPDNNLIGENQSSAVKSTTSATHGDHIVVDGDIRVQAVIAPAKIVGTSYKPPEDVDLSNIASGDEKEASKAIQLTDDVDMGMETTPNAQIQPNHLDSSAPDGAREPGPQTTADHIDEPNADMQAVLSVQHPDASPDPHTIDVHGALDTCAQPVPFSIYADATDDTNVGTTSNKNDQSLTSPAPRIPQDLANTIKGMYRILDLVSEPGSGGLGAQQYIFL